MSKFRSIPYAVLSGALLVGGGASAQSMYDIDRRQDYQQNRIEQGIQSGQITRGEAYRLEQGERAIDRAESRARADGVVTPQERARIDRMTDREGREIYRDSHNSQQAWDRGQQWGHTDGRNDGWRDRDAGRDGWGNHNGGNNNWGDRGGDNRGWGNHDGDPGQHSGWNNGQHNGWDGNRPPGVERRDARQDQRIQNGVRDGSLTRGEANRLERGQDRINQYEARARSDGNVSPYERGRINQMQNNESRRIYDDRHNDRTASNTPSSGGQPGGSQSGSWGNGWNHQPGSNGGGTQTGGTQPGGTQTGGTQPSHGWGNGGWQRQQGGQTTPTAGNQPTQQPTHSWGNNGGWQRPQQASQPAAQPTQQQPQRSWGGNNGGFRMQQASATPQTPRPTYTPTSNPTGSSSRGYRR